MIRESTFNYIIRSVVYKLTSWSQLWIRGRHTNYRENIIFFNYLWGNIICSSAKVSEKNINCQNWIQFVCFFLFFKCRLPFCTHTHTYTYILIEQFDVYKVNIIFNICRISFWEIRGLNQYLYIRYIHNQHRISAQYFGPIFSAARIGKNRSGQIKTIWDPKFRDPIYVSALLISYFFPLAFKGTPRQQDQIFFFYK